MASIINRKWFPGDGSGTLDGNMPGTGVASGSTLYLSTRLAGTYLSSGAIFASNVHHGGSSKQCLC